MKKLSAIFIAFALVFSSFGTTVLFDGEETVEAKRYKSGKKSFNSNPGSTNNNNIQKSDKDAGSTNTNKATNNNNKSTTDTTAKKGGFTAGGLMKGLFIGGLAGLLFGSLFSDMGLIGNILGFMINAAAILFIVFICMKIWQMIKRKNDKEVTETWKK